MEGNCEDAFKNVDESFRIIERLDSSRYEIWYMSYQGRPKSWYRTDKFLYQIPNEKVSVIYVQCDIDSAIAAIECLISDQSLQQTLFENGRKTMDSRDWKNICRQILAPYDIEEG